MLRAELPVHKNKTLNGGFVMVLVAFEKELAGLFGRASRWAIAPRTAVF